MTGNSYASILLDSTFVVDRQDPSRVEDWVRFRTRARVIQFQFRTRSGLSSQSEITIPKCLRKCTCSKTAEQLNCSDQSCRGSSLTEVMFLY